MIEHMRLSDCVGALISGWSERIEYAVRIIDHVEDCKRTGRCLCPPGDTVEQRVRRVTHPPLLAQLQHAAAMPTATGSSGGSANKPQSRPPGNMAPLNLLDAIGEEARFHYQHMWGTVMANPPALGTGRKIVDVLRNLVVLCEQAHDYPLAVHDVNRAGRAWVSKSRIMLGYQKPMTMMADTVCGQCGGALTVAVDASTDVRCAGTLTAGPCGNVYYRRDWLDLLPEQVCLVSTQEAVTHILGDGATARDRRLVSFRIQNWANEGLLTRHGGSTRGTARWDLGQIDKVLAGIAV